MIDDLGTAFSLRDIARDIDGSFFAQDGISRVRTALSAGDLQPIDLDGVRMGSPVARPGMLMCIGLNYRQHAVETGAEIPAEPILFAKASRCVIGPNDSVLIPRTSTKTDYEVELAVVIGGEASYLGSPEAAATHIAGFAIANDVSERAFKLERGGQWAKGKSCDTFNPMGPWLVPADEVNAQHLGMKLWVNGEQVQQVGQA